MERVFLRARLRYAFQGQSWPMKMSGILLLGTAALNPVLIYSVSPKQHAAVTSVELGPSEERFSGFTSVSSVLYSADGTYE